MHRLTVGFRELQSCFEINHFRDRHYYNLSSHHNFKFTETLLLLPHFVTWAGAFDRRQILCFILTSPPCRNMLQKVCLHLELISAVEFSPNPQIPLSCQIRWLKPALFHHSALIWPTFARVVVLHYEKFQKPANISECGVVSCCWSAITPSLERTGH